MIAWFVFFLSLAWLVYVFLGYPVLLAALAALRRLRLRRDDSFLPPVSVLIAARNEEKDIAWKVAETLAWDYPSHLLEVLVASDASEDATDRIVASFHDPRVRLLRMERRGGKNRALNRLFDLAHGEVLFFTDANAHIDSGALRLMVRHFADPRVGCVTGDTRPLNDDAGAPPMAAGAAAYWDYEILLKRLESRLGSVLVCDGAVFCLRRSLFAPLKPELANDLESPMRAAASGAFVLHEPAALAFERETTSWRQEYQRRRRICGQGALSLTRLPGHFPPFRAWQFVSHKLLRWLTLVPLAGLLVSSLALAPRSPYILAFAALQVLGYIAAALGLAAFAAGRPAPRLLAVPFYAVLGFAGAFAGVLDSCAGRRFDVWDIPTLSRGPAAAPPAAAPPAVEVK